MSRPRHCFLLPRDNPQPFPRPEPKRRCLDSQFTVGVILASARFALLLLDVYVSLVTSSAAKRVFLGLGMFQILVGLEVVVSAAWEVIVAAQLSPRMHRNSHSTLSSRHLIRIRRRIELVFHRAWLRSFARPEAPRCYIRLHLVMRR